MRLWNWFWMADDPFRLDLFVCWWPLYAKKGHIRQIAIIEYLYGIRMKHAENLTLVVPYREKENARDATPLRLPRSAREPIEGRLIGLIRKNPRGESSQ